jgi:hypothetical protein
MQAIFDYFNPEHMSYADIDLSVEKYLRNQDFSTYRTSAIRKEFKDLFHLLK